MNDCLGSQLLPVEMQFGSTLARWLLFAYDIAAKLFQNWIPNPCSTLFPLSVC